MNDMDLDVANPEPARQPEAITAGLRPPLKEWYAVAIPDRVRAVEALGAGPAAW
jgi:hypothetical protein